MGRGPQTPFEAVDIRIQNANEIQACWKKSGT